MVMVPPRIVEETSFLNLVLVWNRGVTFGFMNQINHAYVPYILCALSAVVIFLLGRWLWRTSSTVVAVALGMILGGAGGNVIDRVHYGAGVDFLDFYYRDYHWYAFNFADAAIVTGVGLLLLDSLVRAR